MLVDSTRAVLSLVTIQQTGAFLQELAVTPHVLLMNMMSLFRSVLVDTVAKTRSLMSMFSYFIVLHLHLFSCSVLLSKAVT